MFYSQYHSLYILAYPGPEPDLWFKQMSVSNTCVWVSVHKTETLSTARKKIYVDKQLSQNVIFIYIYIYIYIQDQTLDQLLYVNATKVEISDFFCENGL